MEARLVQFIAGLRAAGVRISLAESQDAFYGSDEWKLGPREPILALIETYTSVVIEMGESTVNALRQ